MLKASVCCIGKIENRYIREFVEWYKNLGFYHIYLYDNNDVDGERFEEVINDYIESGYVSIINFRGKSICQLEAYEDCFNKQKENNDWLFFIDIDEFLVLPNHTHISDFLSDNKFTTAEVIGINWKVYDDNDLVTYEDKPCNERFTREANLDIKVFNNTYKENDHMKIFISCKLQNVKFYDPHFLVRNKSIHHSTGKLIPNNSIFNHDFSNAYLKHFIMKTIDEFVNIKIKRGYASKTYDKAKAKLNIENFFKLNNKTQEKLNFIKNNTNI